MHGEFCEPRVSRVCLLIFGGLHAGMRLKDLIKICHGVEPAFERDIRNLLVSFSKLICGFFDPDLVAVFDRRDPHLLAEQVI